MLLTRNITMALASLRSAKLRSLLTMLGIIIGVVSVVTTVSLGEGVRQEVIGQIKRFGPDLITVRPGKTVTRDASGNITNVAILPSSLPSTLTEGDLGVIKNVPNIKEVVPLSIVSGTIGYEGRAYGSGIVVGTTPAAPNLLNQRVEFGEFFGGSDANKHVAVIGKRVAEQLFQENIPVGKSFIFRDQSYIVRGVLEEVDTTPFSLTLDFNTVIFIPYDVSKQAAGGHVQLYQILAREIDVKASAKTVRFMEAALKNSHAGQDDFTVLKADESLTVANRMLNLLTGLIAGIAAISLVVGGIGIMNVMLVSVIERTREVGIRKAVGASNRQILSQFLTEAMVLSIVGGIIGVISSIALNYLIRILTDFKPVITLPIMGISVGVAVGVGIIFGIAPALKAARKDPIEALRYE
jgi:putative ABC transport system permease protein